MAQSGSGSNNAIPQKKVSHGTFHPELNSPHTVSDVVIGSTARKYWWICDDKHTYSAYPSPDTKGKGRRCPVCSGRELLAGYNDLATTHPDVAAEWHPSKNGDVLPSDIKYSTRDKYWWLGWCGHEWEAAVLNRANGNGCYQCRGRKKAQSQGLLKDDAELFAQIHPEKNKGIDLYAVKRFSLTKIWWLGECGHEWLASAASRSSGRSCPYCSGNKLLPGFNDAAMKYPELTEFSVGTKNEPKMSEITYGSKKLLTWTDICGHKWVSTVLDRKRYGCPYCSGQKVLQGFNDLPSVCPDVAAEWHHEKNGFSPEEVGHGSKKSYWWKCAKDSSHEWFAVVDNRTRNNSGCPQCWALTFVSQGEQAIYDYIVSIVPDAAVLQSNRSIIPPYELDIYVPDKGFAVEFNGVYYHSESMGKDKDYHFRKYDECRKRGIHLFTIWEDDWVEKQTLIKKMLAHHLGANNASSVFARKTVFDKVNDSAAAERFMESNHLQGFHGTSSYYGLRDKRSGEWVSMMSVARRRSGSRMEVSRFASSCTVPGGFSKLLTNILRLEKYRTVEKVISYSHNDHSWGEVYQKNGFTKVHDGSPGYFYVVNGKREHRLNYSPKRFREREELFFEEGMTERELAELNGLSRIWDSGSALWERSALTSPE